MTTFNLQSSTLLPHPLERVFDFFSRAENLELLTPPWLRFRILTPTPIEMREGALIDYRLKVHGIPLAWRSEITVWEPPYRFVDEQVRGPYRLWRHEHRFTDAVGGTRVEDSVEYAVWGGALVNRLFVAPDLALIFDYRHARLAGLFDQQAEGGGDAPSAAMGSVTA